jgi:hypothetical protein
MSIKEHPPQSDAPDGESTLHVPVLLAATLQLLDPKEGESYLDLTAGYGGHAAEVLKRTASYTDAILVDRDEYAISRLTRFTQRGVRLISTDFLAATKQLISEGRQFDIVLADLGVSSPQLDQSERGFSFSGDGPLDMRMDRRQEVSARSRQQGSSQSLSSSNIVAGGRKPTLQRAPFKRSVSKSIKSLLRLRCFYHFYQNFFGRAGELELLASIALRTDL